MKGKNALIVAIAVMLICSAGFGYYTYAANEKANALLVAEQQEENARLEAEQAAREAAERLEAEEAAKAEAAEAAKQAAAEAAKQAAAEAAEKAAQEQARQEAEEAQRQEAEAKAAAEQAAAEAAAAAQQKADEERAASEAEAQSGKATVQQGGSTSSGSGQSGGQGQTSKPQGGLHDDDEIPGFGAPSGPSGGYTEEQAAEDYLNPQSGSFRGPGEKFEYVGKSEPSGTKGNSMGSVKSGKAQWDSSEGGWVYTSAGGNKTVIYPNGSSALFN